MDFEMEKVYNPQAIEDKLYRMWEEGGAFVAHRETGKKPFTIVMPPPNITGSSTWATRWTVFCRTRPSAITA